MTSYRQLVVMGVSGTGKSSVAAVLAERLGLSFVEGDDRHPPSNVAKMSAGTPLTDEDRQPWLEELGRMLGDHDAAGEPVVLTCSALRRSYRDLLRARVPAGSLYFVHLRAPAAVLQERMESRDHFMPATLLASQLDTLEPLGDDETGGSFDVTPPLDEVVAAVVDALAC